MHCRGQSICMKCMSYTWVTSEREEEVETKRRDASARGSCGLFCCGFGCLSIGAHLRRIRLRRGTYALVALAENSKYLRRKRNNGSFLLCSLLNRTLRMMASLVALLSTSWPAAELYSFARLASCKRAVATLPPNILTSIRGAPPITRGDKSARANCLVLQFGLRRDLRNSAVWPEGARRRRRRFGRCSSCEREQTFRRKCLRIGRLAARRFYLHALK